MITSIVSRVLVKVNDSEYICDPTKIFPQKNTIKFIDYTQEIIEHTNSTTDELIKNNPVI